MVTVEVVEHRCAALSAQPCLPSLLARLALPTITCRTTISTYLYISSQISAYICIKLLQPLQPAQQAQPAQPALPAEPAQPGRRAAGLPINRKFPD